MILTFEGKQSHACYPENGRNPAFAISELILALEGLSKNPKYRGMTLVTVIAVNVGEHAFGTNAGHGELLLTVRGAFGDELDDLLRAIGETAQARRAVRSQMRCPLRGCVSRHLQPPRLRRKGAPRRARAGDPGGNARRAVSRQRGFRLVHEEDPRRHLLRRRRRLPSASYGYLRFSGRADRDDWRYVPKAFELLLILPNALFLPLLFCPSPACNFHRLNIHSKPLLLFSEKPRFPLFSFVSCC